MATIDIGKIKPVFKGTYDNSTAYVLDDIVYTMAVLMLQRLRQQEIFQLTLRNGTY